MVRSTLLHLPPRGALRAFLGGPLVVLLDDGFSIIILNGAKHSPGAKHSLLTCLQGGPSGIFWGVLL